MKKVILVIMSTLILMHCTTDETPTNSQQSDSSATTSSSEEQLESSLEDIAKSSDESSMELSSEILSSSSSLSSESSQSSSSLSSSSSESSSSLSSSSLESSSSSLEESSSAILCDKYMAPGQHWETITVDGTDRKVLFYIPSGYNDTAGVLPMTFSLHGSTGTPDGNLSNTGIEPLADKHGYIVALMNGWDNLWNTPQDDSKPHDVHFASAIIDHATANFCLDTNRVFSTGFSGGARTSSRFACDIPNRIRAIAPVAGIRYDEPCEESTMPIITFHSRDDNVNVFPGNGGGDARWGESVETAVEGWRTENGCSDVMTTDTSIPDVEIRSWNDCDGEAEVHFYVVESKGHNWSQIDNTTEVILEFFNKYQ
ncbi:MAG: hypothetical protein OCD01_17030 [Fibrobacterales bacterium]